LCLSFRATKPAITFVTYLHIHYQKFVMANEKKTLSSYELLVLSGTVGLGIQQTKELLGFLANLINIIDAALEDGRVTYFETLGLMGLIPNLKYAIDGLNDVPKELADLSAEERTVLVETVRQNLRLRNPVNEELGQKAIDLTLHFVEFVSAVRTARNIEATPMV
jgi:hypothetical protein